MADDLSRSGVTYVTPEVLSWLARVHVADDPQLRRAYETPAQATIPAIMVGPSEGKLLGMLLRLVLAKKVVEIGTLAGYSAIHIARALPEGGRLWTLESDPTHAALARDNLAAAGLSDRVTVIEGKALDSLSGLEAEGPFDAVFVDADKGNYDRYGRWAASHLRPGGLLIGDNALFFGKLLDPEDPSAAAMRRFHEEAALRFDTVCIPTPDGILLGVRRP
jgi:caffeoyl-CoA O-methyltransferase